MSELVKVMGVQGMEVSVHLSLPWHVFPSSFSLDVFPREPNIPIARNLEAAVETVGSARWSKSLSSFL